jgi:hypothetical protein
LYPLIAAASAASGAIRSQHQEQHQEYQLYTLCIFMHNVAISIDNQSKI